MSTSSLLQVSQWKNEQQASLFTSLVSIVESDCKDKAGRVVIETGDVCLYLDKSYLLSFARRLKSDPEFNFSLLLSATVVDWLDEKEVRFEMIYHFLSLSHLHRLRIKCPVAETAPSIASLTSLWESANFMERECFDMFGITFEGHPDLRRILMYEEFKGYPLRKDYPLQGKQPRVALRYPEVRNTAVDMQRAPLVSVNRRKSSPPSSH